MQKQFHKVRCRVPSLVLLLGRQKFPTVPLFSAWVQANGLDVVDVQVLASGLANVTLVRSACSLLRQLANSDAIKAEIVDAGGLELLCRAVDAHTPHAGKAMDMQYPMPVMIT